ncbi:MAG: hypothetical protein ABIZ70_11005 [Gemmatimonadales bacterium]
MRPAARLAAMLFPAFMLTGCSYGAPKLELHIANHANAPKGPGSAFAVYAAWVRPPKALATFPDGGKPLVLAEAAVVYLCDTVTVEVHQLWRADRPAQVRSGFTPWLGPWDQDGIHVSLRGYRSLITDPATAYRVNYRLDSLGVASIITDEPPLDAATSEHVACAEAVMAAAERAPPLGLPK